MTIEQVEILVPTHVLSRRRLYSTGGNVTRESVLVRISDGEGAEGWGETYLRTGVVAIIAELAGLLIGRDPGGATANWALLRGATSDGLAISALSIALDDLRARQLGVPLSDLYGGRIRSRVRAYASSGGYVAGLDPIDAWRAEAEAVQAAGLTAMKLRIGRESPTLERPMLETFAAEAHGLDLMADGNAAYTMGTALDVGRTLADAGYRWFEEPIPTDDYAGYRSLRDKLPIALAGGESLEGRGPARAFIDAGAVDLIQPDPTICGGIGEALFIASLARLSAIACHPHACNGAVALAATLQLLAVLPDPTRLAEDAPLLEYDFGENPLRTDLLTGPLDLEEGWFSIPDGPGLGVSPDVAFLRRTAMGGSTVVNRSR